MSVPNSARGGITATRPPVAAPRQPKPQMKPSIVFTGRGTTQVQRDSWVPVVPGTAGAEPEGEISRPRSAPSGPKVVRRPTVPLGTSKAEEAAPPVVARPGTSTGFTPMAPQSVASESAKSEAKKRELPPKPGMVIGPLVGRKPETDRVRKKDVIGEPGRGRPADASPETPTQPRPTTSEEVQRLVRPASPQSPRTAPASERRPSFSQSGRSVNFVTGLVTGLDGPIADGQSSRSITRPKNSEGASREEKRRSEAARDAPGSAAQRDAPVSPPPPGLSAGASVATTLPALDDHVVLPRSTPPPAMTPSFEMVDQDSGQRRASSEWWEALGPKDSSQGDPDRRGAPKPNGATSSNEDIRRSVDEEVTGLDGPIADGQSTRSITRPKNSEGASREEKRRSEVTQEAPRDGAASTPRPDFSSSYARRPTGNPEDSPEPASEVPAESPPTPPAGRRDSRGSMKDGHRVTRVPKSGSHDQLPGVTAFSPDDDVVRQGILIVNCGVPKRPYEDDDGPDFELSPWVVPGAEDEEEVMDVAEMERHYVEWVRTTFRGAGDEAEARSDSKENPKKNGVKKEQDDTGKRQSRPTNGKPTHSVESAWELFCSPLEKQLRELRFDPKGRPQPWVCPEQAGIVPASMMDVVTAQKIGARRGSRQEQANDGG